LSKACRRTAPNDPVRLQFPDYNQCAASSEKHTRYTRRSRLPVSGKALIIPLCMPKTASATIRRHLSTNSRGLGQDADLTQNSGRQEGRSLRCRDGSGGAETHADRGTTRGEWRRDLVAQPGSGFAHAAGKDGTSAQPDSVAIPGADSRPGFAKTSRFRVIREKRSGKCPGFCQSAAKADR
jgi:hypothetical protein